MQKINPVELSPNLEQIQVRKTVSGVISARMNVPFQVWHMVELMRIDFNQYHQLQVLFTENHWE